MSINTLTFTGRLGKNAEVKTAPKDGKVYASFSVAMDVGYGDSKETYWVECTIWGERGQKIAQYLTKGRHVTVIGQIKPYVWIPQGGDPRAGLRCRVSEIDFGPALTQSAGVPAAGGDDVPF